jgi:drug/metabolite transporter (DMT)-like permease
MSRTLLLGALAAAAAALIGAGWQIASRHAVTTSLGPIEVAWLRYAVPALLLAPLLWRAAPRVPVWHALLLVASGGLPFGLLVLAGARWAPAAHIGVFMAGAMPLFTAAACWIASREPVDGWRWAGLLVVAVGIATMAAGGPAHPGSWRGDVLFLAAAAVWAVYTVALRLSGLPSWHAAALVNAGSALALVLALPWVRPQRLFSAPLQDVLVQAVCQGIVAGVLGLVTYTAAVRRLGPARAALSAAAVPLLTAIGAAAWLDEALEARSAVAGALVAAGIVLAALPQRPR